jgi:DNA-binding MarR family transcriptional regulator
MVAERDGLSQGEVRRRFGRDPSRITRLAQGLENDGLVRRGRDPGDNRVVRMYPTEDGRGLVRGFPERRVGFDPRVGRAIGGEELVEELRRLLDALTDAMTD